MKTYFKHKAESDFGEGMAYLEITEGWPSRQVEIYTNMRLWGDDEHNERLADQPFEMLGLSDEDKISAEEFEHVWNEVHG